MRILLVDDESLIRMDMRDLLESAGHEVVGEGKTGVDAINLAKKVSPDVILMDVNMPELDGIQAARQIAYQSLAPVVLLTAYSQDDLVKKAEESGVYGYLVKPVREKQVLPMLHMALGRYKDKISMLENLKQLERQLEERKLVSRATGILMELYKLSEEEAFKRIRSFSMDTGKTIGETCKNIIESMEKRRNSKKK